MERGRSNKSKDRILDSVGFGKRIDPSAWLVGACGVSYRGSGDPEASRLDFEGLQVEGELAILAK